MNRQQLASVLFAALCMLLISSADARADDAKDKPGSKPARDGAKLLQGKWRVVSAKQNGLPYTKDKIAKMFAAIENDEIRVYVEGTKSEQAARFTIDPEKNPKRIDFTKPIRDGEWDKGLPWQKLFTCWKMDEKDTIPDKAEGIYKLEGDTLTLCWRTTKGKELLKGGASQEAAVRPSIFQSVLYYHQFLFVLERVEPRK